MLPEGQTLSGALKARGVSRRSFVEFCSAMVAILALPDRFLGQVVEALGKARKPVLVWLQFQDCAGNSESILRASHPTVLEVVLDLLSWEYHEIIMAGAGKHAEAALQRVVKEEKGKYLVVVEGAIPLADGGVYCTVAGRTAIDLAREVCGNAAASIAVGACAWDGGLVAAKPNPTGAVGLEEAVPGITIINMPGCPQNPANTVAVLVHYLTFGELPATDQYHRPLFAYGRLIHDQCERRAHYDAGRYVEDWGDEGHRRGWCLYKMGCKGPQATFNCPNVRWNDQTSWPVKAGHGCLACASHRFWDTKSPFYERLPQVPGFGVDVPAGEIGLVLTGAVAGATILHGIASAVRDRARGETRPVEDQKINPNDSAKA
ncbi:MAG TPA: hydrogenase small subunit [Candidatus Acidoferrum sp.]|nr:hydrogenase small subunit [Candidatus Acidoferrum sp.]